MRRKSTIKENWPKFVLQWGALITLILFLSGLIAKIFPKLGTADPETYCPMGGLEALTTYAVRGSLPCSMSSMQVVMGLALAAAVVLFSKLFCAFLCPIGTIEDLLIKFRDNLGLKSINIRNGSAVDKILRIFKYALLFYVFYATATASELICKNFDPYYAVATGFKGEITLWMSLVSLGLVVLGGLFINRFWCRYICPLGAASNTLKFWLPVTLLGVAIWGISALGLVIPWWVILAVFCLFGYILEAFYSRPKLQLMHVICEEDLCNKRCHSCQKHCPYNIDVPSYGKVVNSVDCTLCGECTASCPNHALSIGINPNAEKQPAAMKFLPAIIAVLCVAAGIFVGSRFELPTIDESWGIEEGMELQTLKVENLTSVHCYGSSMAFKAKMEKVRGVHGVKTYVRSHSVVLTYDPTKTSEEKLMEDIFEPSHFRVNSPDPKDYSQLKVQTIRTEHMSNKTDLNYLGLQMRLTEKKIFGLESEYDCPLIVHVYMAPEENLDEDWYREIVEKKVLAMPIHGGGVKETPVDFTFVRLEKGSRTIDIDSYLHNMFDPFKAEFNGRYPSADTSIVRKRAEQYAGKPQFIYEIADQNYEKPIIKKALPYLSNHLSKEEGIIGVYLLLNKQLQPSLQVRFAAPMTAERVWELMTMETWTITYKENEDVREEPAKMKFDKPGICYAYEQ